MDKTEHSGRNPGLDRPATYQIEVEGHLDERWSDWFEGTSGRVAEGGDAVATRSICPAGTGGRRTPLSLAPRRVGT